MVKRFISFISGFLLACVSVSLLILEFRPSLPSLEELGFANAFEPQSVSFDERLTDVVELFDATTSELAKSVREWEGIDLSTYLDWSGPSDALTTVPNNREHILAEISAIALAHSTVFSDVAFDESTGWMVVLDTGDRIVLGDEQIAARLHRALSLFNAFSDLEEKTPQLIDARYAQGVARSELDPNFVAMQ